MSVAGWSCTSASPGKLYLRRSGIWLSTTEFEILSFYDSHETQGKDSVMIAKRRARKRSLIRSMALDMARAGILSSLGGLGDFPMGSSELDHATLDSAHAMQHMQQPDFKMYLGQLSTLHNAGILTDEEFSAASMRLIGS
jgi:hypothetical protein